MLRVNLQKSVSMAVAGGRCSIISLSSRFECRRSDGWHIRPNDYNTRTREFHA